MKYIVYIIESQKDGSRYIGYTTNLEKRIHDHNHGSNKYSSTKMPWIIVWHCIFRNQNKAREFEKYLKHGSGHAFANKHLI